MLYFCQIFRLMIWSICMRMRGQSTRRFLIIWKREFVTGKSPLSGLIPPQFWIPREERKICCLSPSSPLPRLGRAAQVLGCQENPCAGESDLSISWPNTKGCFRLPPYAISNPSDCYLFLNDANQLECDDEFGLRGVGSSAGRLHKSCETNKHPHFKPITKSSQISCFSSKCKARQVWSAGRGKCIAKF